MSRTIIARSVSALDKASTAMQDLLDISDIEDGSALDTSVHAALESLYQAVHDIKSKTRHAHRLQDRGPLVFPMKGRDMRLWRTSDGRRASALLDGRQASRIASAGKVIASPSMDHYRVMTAGQYLRALEDAVITDSSFNSSDEGYEKVRVLV